MKALAKTSTANLRKEHNVHSTGYNAVSENTSLSSFI